MSFDIHVLGWFICSLHCFFACMLGVSVGVCF